MFILYLFIYLFIYMNHSFLIGRIHTLQFVILTENPLNACMFYDSVSNFQLLYEKIIFA